MELQVVLAVGAVVYLGVVGWKGVEGASECKAALVVFGASMWDVGENAVAFPNASLAEFPPFGVDYFHAPANRWSNGRVITDFISQELGYGLLSPYLESVSPNFAHGVNFASSGSTARNSSYASNPQSFSLDVQVKQYKLFKTKVIRAQSKHHGSLRHLPPATGFAKAIHFIASGHNDYISVIGDLTTSANTFDSRSLVASVVSAIESAIRELHTEGARNIIVMNVIPLGCTPAFLSLASKLISNLKLDSDSCVPLYNDLVNLHNSHLQDLIDQLQKDLSMNELVVYDANAIYMDAIRHPSKYGVIYPFMSCCGAGGGKYNVEVTCGSKEIVSGTLLEGRSCTNPSEYISWDGLHFTETFAKHLALGLLSGHYLHPSISFDTICKST